MTVIVFTVHATKKLRTLLGPAPVVDGPSSTVLGPWYATALPWRPQVALFVNEATLLPVLMPLAPKATMIGRFPKALALVLAAHGVGDSFIDAELARMGGCRVLPTDNRSVVGIMNEFTLLADRDRSEPDLTATALWLAGTPCGPLYRRHVSPDRELAALIAGRDAE